MQSCHLSKKLRKREREKDQSTKQLMIFSGDGTLKLMGENEDGATMVDAIMRERKDVKKK